MQEVMNNENMEVAVASNESIKVSVKDNYNFSRWFYYMLLSLTNFYNVYMEIETSAKNVFNPLRVNITSKKKFKKFYKYFFNFLIYKEAKVKITFSEYYEDYEDEEINSLYFCYNRETDKKYFNININFENLTFLLKKIAELSLSSKIAYVRFKYCFLDNTTEEVFFSEYDERKIDEYLIKYSKYNDIENINYIYIEVGHLKIKNYQTNYFKLNFR